uniref:RNA helicase aquarius n=1 Tax=Octopus bimaculoides TaxID=37653 RepID=A0A0L8GB52_OCTBM
MAASGGKGPAPTVEQIQEDVITQLANQFWSPYSLERKAFKPKVIEDIYEKEILATKFSIRRIVVLEFSQYLECYLWPNYNPETATKSHLISIIIMVNEKFRERVPAWEAFQSKSENFAGFFQEVLKASINATNFSLREQSMLLVFLIHCFNSLEVDLIREQVQQLVSLSIWINLLPGRCEELFSVFPKYKKFFNLLRKSQNKLDEAEKKKSEFECSFLFNLIKRYFSVLEQIPETGAVSRDSIHYCERFLELMIDLEAQLPTRRFFNALIDNTHFLVVSKLSNLIKKPEGKLFGQLLDMLEMYVEFEINDQNGEALTIHDRIDIHYNKITALQKVLFQQFEDLQDFAIANVASIDTRQALMKHFSAIDCKLSLHKICAHLNLLPFPQKEETDMPSEFLLELLITKHQKRPSQLETINEMPLYPTENIIWDENIVPTEYFSGEGCLALPKMNLQFLTLHDYLLKNFNLFRLESTYEIRQDIEDALTHMKPWLAEDQSTMFGGWARMVAKPRIGEYHPSQVRADITVNLSVRPEIKSEWEALRKHDVAFLITVKPTSPIGTPYNSEKPFSPQVGLTYVRGCEIEGLLDDNGKVIEEGPEPKPDLHGDTRTLRVWLDPNQYQQDMAKTLKGAEDVYETFNVIMRRKPKENNFKAVLETIRDLMNTDCVVPNWLHDLILGYGSPDAAHYSKMPNQIPTLDWNDTFLSSPHLKESFPDSEVIIEPQKQGVEPQPPFRLTMMADSSSLERSTNEEKTGPKSTVNAEAHIIPNRGPYTYSQPKRNTVPFTPTQIEAIRAGMQPGLTMVVGPPGTGKTDVAVQIISNLYHNFPDQRTLIVTHSNQALNQLFEKIIALDIDERHLLRLGHGEEALETEKDYSRYGRVNYVLAQRLELLDEVARLQESLNVQCDMSYTCETAGYFYLYQENNLTIVKDLFPFTKFFSNAPQPLFTTESFQKDLDIAKGCFRHIKKIFTQLEEFRAFELLRSGADRADYLLIKEAKIIAMTCTHAALKRRDLVQVGFKFDNILMEEAAQILEIETFIPLLLQVITVLSNLYNWRYRKLGNLPHVLVSPEFQMANAGFVYDYQLVDVQDFNGVGESEPNPFFYQNLAEAEYTVAVFMYMRLLGYPAEKISILTTYNGQKHLIRDVIAQRCGNNPFIGRPHKVTTVDRYQGQQNDYILLSLVRTKAVGHLRDVRRLIVALSRARLGLYVFARVSLFRNCFELTPAFNKLTSRPINLHLTPTEIYPPVRKVTELAYGKVVVMEDMAQMAQFVFDFYNSKVDSLMRQRTFAKR